LIERDARRTGRPRARTDQANAIASKPEQRTKRPVTVTARKL
jgi:hypothetical protein